MIFLCIIRKRTGMKSRLNKFLYFVLITTMNQPLIAKVFPCSDSISNPFLLSARTFYGFIIPHSESIRSISYSRPRGITLDAGWLWLGQNAWDYCSCYPVSGISFMLTEFDNPEILGRAYSLMYFIEPQFSLQKRLHFSYRAALGLTYFDNPYDPVTNPLNLFYSSRISFPLQVSFSVNYRANSRLSLALSGHYNHISNGGIKEPNKGINYPTASLGASWYVRSYPLPHRERTRTELYPPFLQVYFTMAGTGKTVSHTEKKRYPVGLIMVEMRKRFARINSWSAGAEWVADYSLQEVNRRNGINKDFNRAGVLAGHHLLIGRFTFYQKLGIYLYSPTKPKDPVYQRYGLIFQINDHWLGGIDLKAHRHVADFLDLRISYILTKHQAKKGNRSIP